MITWAMCRNTLFWVMGPHIRFAGDGKLLCSFMTYRLLTWFQGWTQSAGLHWVTPGCRSAGFLLGNSWTTTWYICKNFRQNSQNIKHNCCFAVGSRTEAGTLITAVKNLTNEDVLKKCFQVCIQKCFQFLFQKKRLLQMLLIPEDNETLSVE